MVLQPGDEKRLCRDVPSVQPDDLRALLLGVEDEGDQTALIPPGRAGMKTGSPT